MKHAAQSTERVAATQEAGAKYREGLVGGGVFTVTCYDKTLKVLLTPLLGILVL